MQNLSILNNINTQYRPNYSEIGVQKNSAADVKKTSHAASPISSQSVHPAFCASQTFSANQVRTSLTGKDEHNKYNEITALIDKKTRKDLHNLLKTGKLLNSNSKDNSTTLDNLYKIATQKRITGLDSTNILKEVISTIEHPFNITQKFGDVPVNLQNDVISQEKALGKNITAMDLDVKSSTCPAASIEFNLAHKMPAEFARIAEGLTSEKIPRTNRYNLDA